ncbi:MAG: PD40 domain-containing protein [Nitratireductor sp.]|nr:PD40 domain-containing protein [Nitratireductor sp.]
MTISLVSEATTGNSGNADSYTFSPGGRSVSADGRYVVYESDASDLVAGDANGRQDIFLYDTVNDTTTLVSKDTSGGGADSNSYAPSLSADGRYVVYRSLATDLVTGDANSKYDIFLYDRVNDTTTLISKDTSGGGADNHSYAPPPSPPTGATWCIPAQPLTWWLAMPTALQGTFSCTTR